jgi:hypothetical protein
MRHPPLDPRDQDITDLRTALAREQARCAALEKRAALLEESAKRAWRLALDGRREAPQTRREPEAGS